MNPFDSKAVVHHAQQASYMDLKDLQSIRKDGVDDKEAALEKIAKQFESIMLHTMLKTMRESNAAFSEGSSSEMQFHQDMFDHQLGLNMSQGKGLGIADSFLRQMKQQFLTVEPNGLESGEPLALDKIFTRAQAVAMSPTTDAAVLNPFAELIDTDQTAAMTPVSIVDLNVPFVPPVQTPAQQALLLKAEKFAAMQADASLAAAVKRTRRVELSAGGVKQAMAMTPEEFVEKVKPYAEQAAQKLGVDSRVLIAQAALETGWGQHVIHQDSGRSSHNLFNIKAGSDWKQDKVAVSTLEFDGNVARHEQAQFRVYDGMAESFADYTQFIGERPRYANAVAKADNPYHYLQELQSAGYATDPKYAEKVWNVFRSDVVQAVDVTKPAAPTVMARND